MSVRSDPTSITPGHLNYLKFAEESAQWASHPRRPVDSSENRLNSAINSILLGFSRRSLGLAGICQGVLLTLYRNHRGKAGPTKDATIFINFDFGRQRAGRTEVLDQLGSAKDGIGGLNSTLGRNGENVGRLRLGRLRLGLRLHLGGSNGAGSVRGGLGSDGGGGVLHGCIIPRLNRLCRLLFAQSEIKGLTL